MEVPPQIEMADLSDVVESLAAGESGSSSADKPEMRVSERLLRTRTWAEVDLGMLGLNVRRIQDRIQPSRLLVVVKKDAYGHGLIPVARALGEIGVRYLGVAAVGEGIALRAAGVRSPIVHIGIAVAEEIESAVERRIDLSVASLDDARVVAEAAGRLGHPARVHLKVDTGMGRLGLYPEQLVHQIDAMAALPNLEWVGLYSHLADCPGNAEFTNEQLDWFRRVAAAMSGWLHLRHLGASGAIDDRRLHFDMLRVGIAAYGADPNYPEFEPVMTMKSRLVFIKNIPAGRPIGYGSTFVTSRPTRVGVVAAGYGNGYPRRASGRGHVLIGGRPAPILGLVCMDQMMVDLNEHPDSRLGDPVLLFGRDGEACLPPWEVADWADTISYELLCCAGAMTPRVYLGSASPGGKSETGGV